MRTKFDLKKRELEICELIAEGLSNEQIAKLLFLTEGTVKNYVTSIYEKTGISNRAQLAATYVIEYAHVVTDFSDSPESMDPSVQNCPKLRLIGSSYLPDAIHLRLNGQPYTIGRFDVSAGKKQCDFEFDKATKAVSRRHAAIECASGGVSDGNNGALTVVDLNSSAGTFVNGYRITPGKPHPIQHGDRISFGTMGAEYVLET